MVGNACYISQRAGFHNHNFQIQGIQKVWTMISLLLFFLAGACRGLFELLAFDHKDSIFSARVHPESFWGSISWRRKYKKLIPLVYIMPEVEQWPSWKRWYYKTFKIKYPERFPFSATMLVWLTDGMHLMNFLMKFFLIGACVTYTEGYHWLWMIAAYILAWTGGFNLTYSFIFQRRLR